MRALNPVISSLLVTAVLLGAGGAAADEVPLPLRDLKVVALAPADGRAVVRDGEGTLVVLAVGDALPEAPAAVARIVPGRLVLLLDTEDGPREVWVEPVAGAGPDRVRVLELTADDGWELSKPLIQPVGPPVYSPEKRSPAAASNEADEDEAGQNGADEDEVGQDGATEEESP